ncbi:MAG: hypothetical protein ACD_39C00333G0004 [uncultured bacterium]|nr:MAG: hypothetical protein ACD_39C00333G0004 [uncultured bacterium]
MKTNRSGFTLMEIMVVIIVIAVLASVAGPMIGSITDQGRASATKSKLSGLKSALLTYQSDVGRFPYVGNADNSQTAKAYNEGDTKLLGDNMEANVLVNEGIGNDATGFNIKNYNRRWKGPYMDSDPSDFMLDSWGVKIKYQAHKDKNNIYLWSSGPDMAHGNLEDAINVEMTEGGEEDDIAISIARTRKKFL